MQNKYNPFADLNDKHIRTGEPLVYPKFKKVIAKHVPLSLYASQNIQALADKYAGGKLHELLELIGLNILQIHYVENITDEYTDIDNATCRQAGFEDAMNNENEEFKKLFPEGVDNNEIAYHQGYLEGTFVRSHKVT